MYKRSVKQSVEKHGHMADIVYPDTEALLASKKRFHILHTNRSHRTFNTEMMVTKIAI